jgi:hypothetical protein
MNRNNIAGAVFLVLWVAGMLLWGMNKKVVIDQRGNGGYEPAVGSGHPLYQDY